MSEYEVIYLKENINFKYEILNERTNENSEGTITYLYYKIKITKPPERKTKILILFFDCLSLVNKLKDIYKNINNHRYGYLRIFFESYKNSKNIYDTTTKMIYFTNVTDEVKKYFSSKNCNSSIFCFNIKYEYVVDEHGGKNVTTIIDYGFRVNYVLNDMKYIDSLGENKFLSKDNFPINSYINVDGISFYIVFAVYYKDIIKNDEEKSTKSATYSLNSTIQKPPTIDPSEPATPTVPTNPTSPKPPTVDPSIPANPIDPKPPVGPSNPIGPIVSFKDTNQDLVELQNYLNPIVEVGFKELIEKTRLNEKYKQILYLTVLKDDF